MAAVTVNVYAVPFVSPATVAKVANQETTADFPPGDAVTVYPVTADPPSPAGAVQDTTAWASPAVAKTLRGASGTTIGAFGVTAIETAEADDVPTRLVAITVNVYAVPLVSPATVTVVAPVGRSTPT